MSKDWYVEQQCLYWWNGAKLAAHDEATMRSGCMIYRVECTADHGRSNHHGQSTNQCSDTNGAIDIITSLETYISHDGTAIIETIFYTFRDTSFVWMCFDVRNPNGVDHTVQQSIQFAIHIHDLWNMIQQEIVKRRQMMFMWILLKKGL